jgi:hypothetical protein
MGRKILPVLISAGLLTWLIWSVSPGKLAAAFSITPWPWLLLATAVQVAVLFFWDTFSLWWLFSQPDRKLPFRKVLRARTDSALWSAVNLEIGQGVFAYTLAKMQNESVANAMGRCSLLALFDFGTLVSLGLIGSFVMPEPSYWYLRWICVGALGGLSLLAVALRFPPSRWRRWLVEKPWAHWLAWWSWRHGILLVGQRMIMYLLAVGYVGVGLVVIHVPVDFRLVFGRVPFVLLAESLPGTGGIGGRETGLVYLLGSERNRADLLVLGLIWSGFGVLARSLIGLASWLLPRRKDEDPDRSAHRQAERRSEQPRRNQR